ncbi:MAG: hypothetical protein Q9191_003751 [Dirinaria sp. TL-2023a]
MQKTQIPSALVRCRHIGFRDRPTDRVLITCRSFHRSSHQPASQAGQGQDASTNPNTQRTGNDSKSSSSSSSSSGLRPPRPPNQPTGIERAFDRLSRDSKPFFKYSKERPSKPPRPAPPNVIDVRSLAALPSDVQERLAIRKVATHKAFKRESNRSRYGSGSQDQEKVRSEDPPEPLSRGFKIRPIRSGDREGSESQDRKIVRWVDLPESLKRGTEIRKIESGSQDQDIVRRVDQLKPLSGGFRIRTFGVGDGEGGRNPGVQLPRGGRPLRESRGAHLSGEPKPRKNKARDGFRRAVPLEEMTLSSSLQGLKSKNDVLKAMKELENPEVATYQPSEVTLESLQGNGPAIPLTEWGMTEVVEEWVDKISKASTRRREVTEQRAKKLKKGDFVPFGNKGIREQVTDAAKDGIGEMSEEEQAAAAGRLREIFGNKFAEKVFKGSYVFDARGTASIKESLASQTTRNASLLPQDRESLVGKVRAILPPANSGGSQTAAKA